jgi:hypothetical protein
LAQRVALFYYVHTPCPYININTLNPTNPHYCSLTLLQSKAALLLVEESESEQERKRTQKMRASNHLIGVLNFLTFLLSIPILGGGIWLSTRANNTDCLKFLQWPLIIIGVSIMVVSLAGFAGACYRNTFIMWMYLFAMFFIIAALLVFIIFAYVVTDKGSGRTVPNRAYSDYYLQDYSGWLALRVADDSYWAKISSCIRDSKVCSKMARTIGGVPETADMFALRKLNPIEVCKNINSLSFFFLFSLLIF